MEYPQKVDEKIKQIESELADLDLRRNILLAELVELRKYLDINNQPDQFKLPLNQTSIHNQSPQEEKIRLFRSLFRGRDDVFPRRFENVKTGKTGYAPVCQNEWAVGICQKPKTPCQECNYRVYQPVSDDIICNHLRGNDPQEYASKDFTIGVYPLLSDETCWFLAVDFDKSSWVDDAIAFLETCKKHLIPSVLERSRSGNGGHVWIFFENPIPSATARKLGTILLTKTMQLRPEIGLDSYDRLFPSQDTMPRGGFGNLIALPLQKRPRQRGNSVFIDKNLEPYSDQWEFLSSIKKLSLPEVEQILYQNDSEIICIRSVVLDETENEPWKLTPSRTYQEPMINVPLPEHINLVIGNQIYIEKEKLPAPLRNRLIRLAAFQNPEFYKAQAMHLSTFGKPRIISCCEDYPKHLGLPRGCYEELMQLFEELNIHSVIQDKRENGQPISVSFHGNMRNEQRLAATQLLQYDIGVLSASTAFGKTVIGIRMIAERKVNTLIIVHRKQLMEQWIESLQTFLGLTKNEIGQIGGGKHIDTGMIDVAMIQSLIHKGIVKDIMAKYGQIIIDECHHISASSFEQVIRQAHARFIVGLSATVTRRDGHHPIIFMQCGPIRYRVNERQQAATRLFSHKVIVHRTGFSLPIKSYNVSNPSIQEIYTMLAADMSRNQIIIDDVLTSIQYGHSPVLLTERREHLAYFVETLSNQVKNVIPLTGGMNRKRYQELITQLKSIPEDEDRLIIATGRYLGEGFDDSRLDTLFLALPIAWRGTVAQYAGRLHRKNDRKSEVIIYDYVDDQVPVLARMFKKREKAYKAIGYDLS